MGKIRLELTNTGNISDSLVPSVPNLPNDWNVAFSFRVEQVSIQIRASDYCPVNHAKSM